MERRGPFQQKGAKRKKKFGATPTQAHFRFYGPRVRVSLHRLATLISSRLTNFIADLTASFRASQGGLSVDIDSY